MGKFNLISMILSIAGIIIALRINYEMALRYESADGKTHALFGLVALGTYGYRYYYIAVGLVALACAITGLIKKERRKMTMVGIALSLVCIASFLLDIWKLL